MLRTRVREVVHAVVPAGWVGIGGLDAPARARFRSEVRAGLAERDWVAPLWPVEYGGAGLTATELIVLVEGMSLPESRSVPTTTS